MIQQRNTSKVGIISALRDLNLKGCKIISIVPIEFYEDAIPKEWAIFYEDMKWEK